MTEQTNPIDQLGSVATYEEQMEEFLKQLAENIDPMDFMTPTQREIARLPLDQLTAEYELVVAKQSNRSAAQRKFITQRYEHEQNAARESAAEQDSTDASANS
jgi:hypothetical protein